MYVLSLNMWFQKLMRQFFFNIDSVVFNFISGIYDLLISIAGNILFSDSFLSRCTSILPVPLNSSKITSSILLPVSIKAVPRIVKLPASSVFLAAPKKRFGLCNALGSKPPDKVFPDYGITKL